MDNAKALIKHSSWYEGEVQQTVRSLCNYYDIEPWACQPRRPKQKNRVEAGVGLAQRWIIAAIELESPPMARDLDDLTCLLQVLRQTNRIRQPKVAGNRLESVRYLQAG